MNERTQVRTPARPAHVEMSVATAAAEGGCGALVLVAIAWAGMPDVVSIQEFHRLVDTHGTGNITEPTRERGRHRHVRFTGKHDESRRDGTTVVNAQARPVGRAVVAEELEQITVTALG